MPIFIFLFQMESLRVLNYMQIMAPSITNLQTNWTILIILFSSFSLSLKVTQRLCDEDSDIYDSVQGILNTGLIQACWIDQISGMVKIKKDGKIEAVRDKEQLEEIIGDAFGNQSEEEEEIDEANV